MPNKIPKNIFVLITAKRSNPFEILFANICVIVRIIVIKIISNSKEKNPVLEIIIKNQNDNPAVTVNDLNLGELACILNRIDERYKATLCKGSQSNHCD